MNVTFTKTGERRYRISVEGPGVTASWMEPAPGFDEKLPHDVAHFVVENELGLTGGVFGQLASGGTAGTFHPVDEKLRRKIIRRGKKLAASERDDAGFSEKVVAAAHARWAGMQFIPDLPAGLSEAEVESICREFDAVSEIWSGLDVGDSMTLEWRAGKGRKPGR